MAVEQHAELVDAVVDLVLVQDVPARLHLAGGAEHLVQRQHRVVGRMIGVVAGRPVDHLVAVAQREVVGDRDRLVVRDQEAVLRPGVGHHERTRVLAPGLQQIDRGAAALGVLAAIVRQSTSHACPSRARPAAGPPRQSPPPTRC